MDDDFLLPLYRLARERDAAGFQRGALQGVQKYLHFESAFWGKGRFLPEGSGVVAHDAYLEGIDPEFLRAWSATNQQDSVVGVLEANPGHAFSIDVKSFFSAQPDYAALGERHSIRNISVVTAPRRAYQKDVMWVSLYRSNASDAHSRNGLSWLAHAMPHLAEAWMLNRAIHGATRTTTSHPSYFAVADKQSGVLIKCEAGFLEHASNSWSGFDNGTVPISVRRRWDQTSEFSFAGRRGHFYGVCLADLVFLSIDLHHEDLRLTPRQLEIATLFCRGVAYKKIATLTGIAPATVRNHLAAVYAELGVHTRDELEQALGGLKNTPT